MGKFVRRVNGNSCLYAFQRDFFFGRHHILNEKMFTGYAPLFFFRSLSHFYGPFIICMA